MSPHNFVDFQKVSYTKRILWVASEDIRSHSVTCSKCAPDEHDQGYRKTFRDFGLKDFSRTQLALFSLYKRLPNTVIILRGSACFNSSVL